MDVKDMYPCFHNLEELQQSEEDESHDLKITSNPATPCTPITPIHSQSPNTPASHSISDDTDKSFSLSMDSGLGSPDDFNIPQGQPSNFLSVRNLIGSNKTPRSSKAAEHTSKEKQRRERIKESCDQLRVLLPYIRGRKTDMASTLEMCVDYLHIVNTFMPEGLQDQIVDILGKDSSLVPNSESLLRRKKKDGKLMLGSPSPIKAAAMISPAGGMVSSSSVSDSDRKSANSTLLTLAPADNGQSEGKGPKRIRLQDLSDCAGDSIHMDGRLDPTVAGHGDVKLANYMYHAPPNNNNNNNNNMHHNSNFQDLEEQNFSSVYRASTFSDNYNSTQQYFAFSANKNNNNNNPDTDAIRPMYVDSTLYHYYPSVLPSSQNQARLYSPSTDYVNPNTVLPGVGPFNNIRIKSATESMKEELNGRPTG